MTVTLDVPRSQPCSFCQDLAGDRECAFVVQTREAAVLINERPYEQGAMLVIPRTHCETVFDIMDSELEAVHQLARRVARAAIVAFDACGVNIFQNNGIKAGQSEPHCHVHVVPRYEHSDPERRFQRADYAVLSLAEQRAVAAALREAL